VSNAKGSQITGYKYFMGLHMGLCHGPVDDVVEIRGGDRTVWAGNQTSSGEIYISAPDVYGGDQKEGGVVGTLDVMMGEASQGPNSYLQNVIGGIATAFRGLLTCVWRAGEIGSNNPYPKPWAFRVQRATQGWDGGAAWYSAKARITLADTISGDIIAGQWWNGSTPPDGWNVATFNTGGSDSGTWTDGICPMASYADPTTAAANGFATTVQTSVPSDGERLLVRYSAAITNLPSTVELQLLVRGSVTVYFNGTAVWSGGPYASTTYVDVSISAASLNVGQNIIGFDVAAAGSQRYLDWRLLGLANVKAMNPAHIVYECITNRDWGMGYPVSVIDTAAFTAAADQLYAEGFGLCLLWTRTDTIENFLQSVMDHAGAVLVQSKTTGLFQFNLIRGGYDVSTLPVFTEDNLIELTSYEQPAISGATNEVVVQWFDPVNKAHQSTTAQALGAIQSQGVIVSASKDYPGLPTADLAARVAARDLAAVSTLLKRVQVKLDRSAFALLPGGLFVLNLPSHGVTNMVCRVGEVDYGTLTSGAIGITAVQDVFDMPATVYLGKQQSGWAAPDQSALPSPYVAALEADYRKVYLSLSAYDLSALPANAAYAGLVAARPSSAATSYFVNSAVGSATPSVHGSATFAPTGTLSAAIAAFDTSIMIANGIDLAQVSVPCAAVFDGETVAVTALNPMSGVATIARGCVDTVPAPHAAGARIWFIDGYTGSDGVEYTTGETVVLQPLTTTSTGTLAASAAPSASVTLASRWEMPYPPANMMVQGTRWDQVNHINGSNFTISWAERNRLTQQDQLVDNTQSTISPEAGTTYTITIYGSSGAAIYTASGIVGTSWTWGTPDTTQTSLSIKLQAVRGGVTSWQAQVMPQTPCVWTDTSHGTAGPAFTGSLTNPACQLIGYANGPIPDYSPAAGTFRVFSGSTEVTASATFSVLSQQNVVGTISPGGVYQVSSITGTSGTLTLMASYGGVVLTKVFTVTVLNAGYQVVTALPTTSLFEGEIALLKTDGKLYRYHAGAWTAATDGADIKAGTITAGALSTGTLITASAQIGNLVVDTINIKDNAVTGVVAAYATATVDLYDTTISYPTTVHSASISTTGGVVSLIATISLSVATTDPGGSGNYVPTPVTLALKRDGTTIQTFSTGTLVNGSSGSPSRLYSQIPFQLTDTPTTGSHTYTIVITGATGATMISYAFRGMELKEVKK
jgi:hypothetical protein